MTILSKTSKTLLMTTLLVAFAAGCNRQAPGTDQTSSTTGMTGTDTTTASDARSAGSSDAGLSSSSATLADTSRSSSDTSGTATSSGTSGSSGASDSSGASSASTGTASKAGTVIDDSIITTKVKTALLADPDIKSSDISVETKKGEVMLSGFINDPTQIERATTLARNVEGVKDVQNKMSVKK